MSLASPFQLCHIFSLTLEVSYRHLEAPGLNSLIPALARDFAFVAGDKDSCMLKCHVFRCDVPAKAIASALQGLCAQVRASGGQGIWSWVRVGLAPDSNFPFFLCASCWLRCILDLVGEGRSQWRSCLLFPRSYFP